MFIRLIVRLFSLFFQSEQYFSLATNQSTIFFSRLISTAERLQKPRTELRVCVPCPFICGVVITSIEKMVCASAKQKSSLALLQTGALFSSLQNPEFGTIKKKILITLKCWYMYKVLNVDEIKN
jgi:hypothetical protein